MSLPAEVPFLPAGLVREIVGWSGDNVNGVQVVYDVGGMTVRAPKHLGEHGLYRQSSLVLDVADGEVRQRVESDVRVVVGILPGMAGRCETDC